MSKPRINLGVMLMERAAPVSRLVLDLHVDETLYEKVKRRERTRALRPANAEWDRLLKGVKYTHIQIHAPSGRTQRILFKSAERRCVMIAPDKQVSFWEVIL